MDNHVIYMDNKLYIYIWITISIYNQIGKINLSAHLLHSKKGYKSCPPTSNSRRDLMKASCFKVNTNTLIDRVSLESA